MALFESVLEVPERWKDAADMAEILPGASPGVEAAHSPTLPDTGHEHHEAICPPPRESDSGSNGKGASGKRWAQCEFG